MNPETPGYRFVGGNLALDFINTVACRFDPEKVNDRLKGDGDIRRWASQARLPGRAAIDSCAPLSAAALSYVRAIREHLFAIFRAAANDDPISAVALRSVDNALRRCRAKRCLSIQGSEVRWSWGPDVRCSDFLLYPILTAATALLTSVSRGLVRQCADEGCGWLFLDRSNARQRRWCSMADCGNRYKAREHYRRKAGLV